MKSEKVAITHLVIGIDSKVNHHVVAMDNVAEQHILTKCNTFQVTHDLLMSEHLKIATAQLCKELSVCNFTML